MISVQEQTWKGRDVPPLLEEWFDAMLSSRALRTGVAASEMGCYVKVTLVYDPQNRAKGRKVVVVTSDS